jgi:8-oxo-dGTP diphosphatase
MPVTLHLASTAEDQNPGLNLDSVAAVIHAADGRYLMQHREDRPGISYPGWWSLFGGAREEGETALAAIRRELMEELEYPLRSATPFIGCLYDIFFEARRARKIFFEIPMAADDASRLVLHEGQGMNWFTLDEILDRARTIVPYDLGILTMHHSQINRRAPR